MIFGGELDESSHEIFEVFNNQSISFIGDSCGLWEKRKRLLVVTNLKHIRRYLYSF